MNDVQEVDSESGVQCFGVALTWADEDQDE